MKKLFFILVLLSCFAAGFAETGYKGFEWGCFPSEFPEENREVNFTVYGWENAFIYKENILNIPSYTFYGFSKNTNQFINAGYVIPSELTKNLKEKLTGNKKTEKKINLGQYNQLDKFLKELQNEKDGLKEYQEFEKRHDYLYYFMRLADLSTQLELGTYSKQKPNYKVLIYDYNNDTRLYLFENTIKDKTVVVFIPKIQDY